MTSAETPQPTFDAAGLAKHLLRSIRSGSFATLSASGHPFATLVNVATDFDGSPILLLSLLAVHTCQAEADPRCSLLLAQTGKGDPLAHPRLTLVGQVARANDERLRGRFLRRHPKAELYAGFADFGFFRLRIEAAHLNGGFGKAAELEGAAILTETAAAEDLLAAEEAALAHLNQDHPDALRRYATKLAREADAAWRATGIDPEGLDLMAGDRTARVAFGGRITDAAMLRIRLKELAEEARSRAD